MRQPFRRLLQLALEQEARIASFKTEVTKSQELHLAGLTRDTERLTNNLEKIRAEIRYRFLPHLTLPQHCQVDTSPGL